LRLYEADNETPKKKLVYHVSQRIRDGVKVVLGVGLTRPWKKEGEDKALHWLQVNNIHLEDNPTWGFTSS
jgi:acyl CoA:acetate/3-ketoacid CoA transferase beta subunit